MWAGTVCFLVNHALLGPSTRPAPGAEPALKKCLLKYKSQVIRSSLWFLIQSLQFQAHVCILQMPLRLLLSNWLWKRINSHDEEGRKRELAYLAPGSVNPPVQMKSLIKAHPREPGGGGITVNLVILFYSRWWFCWSWFWPIDLPLWVSEVAQSCPTLCDPMDSNPHQAPPSMGFSYFQSSFTYSPASF